MPHLVFNPYLFLRTPTLSYQDHDINVLEALLKQQSFQSTIFFASESLYMELERCDFIYTKLEKKAQLSLQKYFNRMCYRPTPFGMFSAFSSLTWSLFEGWEDLTLDEKMETYINPDFQFTAGVARQMEASGVFNHIKYYPTRSIYAVKGEKRYLSDRFNDQKKKTEFFINSFGPERLLNRLLVFCRSGKTKTELATWLGTFTDDPAEADSYLDDLREQGLLISELAPNMTGEKYFERLVKIADGHQDKSGLAAEILSYKNMLVQLDRKGDLNFKKIAGSDLYGFYSKKVKSMFYVNCEKKSSSVLDKKYQGHIKDGLHCLSKIATDIEPRSLNTFVKKFKARFEDQEVPFLLALDREAGVGYEGLESDLAPGELLDGIHLNAQAANPDIKWTPVHLFFLQKIVKAGEGPVSITDDDLVAIKKTEVKKMPPSFSIVFRLFGDKIWLEQAGGCTATALLGRFSLFNKQVLEEARYITSIEEKTNEDVIFAEISCFNDEHAANINANAGLRRYEIPIGVHSTFDSDHTINLEDLAISIVNNNIVLRSKKLNKVVIPRLSSAFNFSRSELSIFRFLCDLQYQGLQFNFNFDFKALLPGLNYYPRVEYKKCILFPATWVLNATDIDELTNTVTHTCNFKKICEKYRLPKLFALTEGDNQLVFGQDDPASVGLFIHSIKNKTEVILQEVFLDQQTDVQGAKGKPHTGQFIASVFADEVTYMQQRTAPASNKNSKLKRIYLPGDEWVYFKLYCHPATSNNVLTKEIDTIVTGLKRQNILKSWFFIRYADPDHHIRIRIKINPDDTGRVVKYFHQKMHENIEHGCVNNMVLDTYKREIERYGEATMEQAEQVFYAGSDLVVNFLKNVSDMQTDVTEVHVAIVSVDALLGAFFPGTADRIILLKQMHEGMKHEFDDSKALKVQLDSKYRQYSSFFNNMTEREPEIIHLCGKKEFDTYNSVLKQVKADIGAQDTGRLMKLAADLVHMQLNRIFSDKQRSHEFVIYYLMYKYYQSVQVRKEKQSSAFSPAFKGPPVHHLDEVVLK